MPGIHRARARPHHQPFERREAHRRIDALAVADRGQRTAVAQVAGDHALRLRAQDFGRPPRDVLVADAVKAVAADALLQPVVRAGIDVGGGRQRGVKGGIENRDLRDAVAQLSFDRFDQVEFQPVVLRARSWPIVPAPLHFGCDARGLARRPARRARCDVPPHRLRTAALRAVAARPSKLATSRDGSRRPSSNSADLMLLEPAFTTRTFISWSRSSRGSPACRRRAA